MHSPNAAVLTHAHNNIAKVTLQVICAQSPSDFQAEPALSLDVISVGSEAYKLSAAVDTGRVIAVFERCFYLQYGSGIICIGIRTLGEGPLQIVLDSDDLNFLKIVSNRMQINLVLHSRVYADKHAQQHHESLDDMPSRLFSGHVPVIRPDESFKKLIKEKLQSLKPTEQPARQHGFGWIAGVDEWQIKSVTDNPASAGSSALNSELNKLCIPAITSLIDWLNKYRDWPAEASKDQNAQNDSARGPIETQIPLTFLLGAGPGLTPAGDDLLAGVLLALHYSDQGNCAKALWNLLEPQVNHRTNAISAAHLSLAAAGQCAMPVQQLLECLFSGSGGVNCAGGSDAITSTGSTGNVACMYRYADIPTLADSVGASSGWDMLAGMTLVVRAL